MSKNQDVLVGLDFFFFFFSIRFRSKKKKGEEKKAKIFSMSSDEQSAGDGSTAVAEKVDEKDVEISTTDEKEQDKKQEVTEKANTSSSSSSSSPQLSPRRTEPVAASSSAASADETKSKDSKDDDDGFTVVASRHNAAGKNNNESEQESEKESDDDDNDDNGDAMLVKHPLQNEWTLWYDNSSRGRGKASAVNWGDHLKEIMTFGAVEDFWRLFNNIVPASKLSLGSNYHLFKRGIQPTWEDAENEKGGKWVHTHRGNPDKIWLWVVLAVIGEGFEPESEICGAVLSVRKGQNRLALWTRDADNADACVAIGKRLKQVMELGDDIKLGYQSHKAAMRQKRSFTNPSLYTA
jgi:translation initiation factor 4E